MPATHTYGPVLYAPATARTQLATMRRHREPRAAAVSYRASVPAGHAGCGLALSYRALSPDGESLSSKIEKTIEYPQALILAK